MTIGLKPYFQHFRVPLVVILHFYHFASLRLRSKFVRINWQVSGKDCSVSTILTTSENAISSDRRLIYLNLWSLVGLVVTSIGLFWLTNYHDQILTLDFQTLGGILSIYVAALVVFAVVVTPGDIWAPSSVYLIMLALFHFGAVAAFVLGQISEEMAEPLERWFYNAWMSQATVLAATGITACSLGVFLAGLGTRPVSTRQRHSIITGSQRTFAYYLTWVGFAMVSIGVFAWFALVVRSGGIGLLFGSYADYLLATSTVGMGYVWILLGAGLAFLAATSGPNKSRLHLIAYMCFGIFALFALPLGLRGEVLFTTLGALVVRARRGLRPSARATIVGALILLVLISAIREVRQVGIGSVQTIVVGGGLFDGVTELGSTLRPVVEVLDWETPSDNGQSGATYWAPVDRFLCTIQLVRDCVPASDDDRLMNVVVSDRLGPIGFSPIAEAYENFREIGIIFVMGAIGFLVGLLNKWKNSPFANAMTGLIMVELLINVRNAFTALPAHLLFGFGCVFAAWIFTKMFPLPPLSVNDQYSIERELSEGKTN